MPKILDSKHESRLRKFAAKGLVFLAGVVFVRCLAG
jgi:hypothetical protein